MDKASKETLDIIIAKDVNDLTPYDKQFLVGRRDHLTKDEMEKFGDVIQETLSANTAGQEPAPKKK